MLLIVVKVFNNFFKDDAADIFEMTDPRLSFTEIV
jgi:hypothetical protein